MEVPPSNPVIEEVVVRDFRSAVETVLTPGPVCALVGEAEAGKSNVLAAVRAVLDPQAPLDAADVRRGSPALDVRARLLDGRRFSVRGRPPDLARDVEGDHPPLLFLPAALRSASVLATPGSRAPASGEVHAAFARALRHSPRRDGADSAAAGSIASAVLACSHCGARGAVLLVEEPELYLRPQAQRYLARVLREFAGAGNQVIFSTHSPSFLNVGRLEEVVFVERQHGGTRLIEPRAVQVDADFRVLSEFDAERAELLLAEAAVLVEGQTEKLALPFVFEALGHDVDLAGVTIVECGGKWNIPLFARVCRAVGLPFVAIYDRDAPPGRRPSAANRAVAAAIHELAGPQNAIELAADFEAVAGLQRMRHGKPEQAWRHFAALDPGALPAALIAAVERAMALATTPVEGPR